MKQRLVLIIVIIIVIFPNIFSKPISQGNVILNGTQLYVNGADFKIKGVGYQPTPIGESSDYNFYNQPSIYTRDFSLLRNMSANTIRTWGKIQDGNFLNSAYNNGSKPIYVIMGFWVNCNEDYSNTTIRQNYINDFGNYVTTYKNYSAVLMWALGNENNLDYCTTANLVDDLHSMYNEMAKKAYEIEGSTYHPVAIINGDIIYLGDVAKKSDDAFLNYTDVWGINTYPGSSLTAKINEYSNLSSKPLFVSEYGTDAFNNSTLKEDEKMQADWDLSLWGDIANSSVTLGGTIMEYSDEWWKYSSGVVSIHDNGGYYPSWNPNSHPDQYVNEEYWGIVRPVDNGTNTDIIQPRKAYYALASEFSKQDKEIGFQEGFVLTSYWYNDYLQQRSNDALVWLNNTGTEFVSILITWYQDNATSTKIYRNATKTPSDNAVINAINRSHNLGMKVVLKPHVDPMDGTWRGDINFSNENDWRNWFDNYTAFINYYADLAETNKVEGLVIGTEYKSTTSRETDWRIVIGNIRTRFSGFITYSANWDNYQNINWWDSLDFIGISAYFPLTSKYDPTLEELKNAWLNYTNELKNFSETNNKPIVFTEVGFQSRNGTNTKPDWAPTTDIDYKEQEEAYNATLTILFNESSWFKGMYWWMWYWDPLQDINGFDIYNKPAENILKKWYNPDYSYKKIINSNKTEYRFYLNNSHFLTIIDENGTFNIRPHPGVDVNGWGSSLYMQPFLPGAVLKHTKIQTIRPFPDKIEVEASGAVSNSTNSTFGSWNISISFSYNQAAKEINGQGSYKISLSNNLSNNTGDLNLLKIASNYLDDVPLLTGITMDTGDMQYANIRLNSSNFTWNPSNQTSYFQQDKTDFISINVIGQLNNIDTVSQGYARIEPAYKPSLEVALNSLKAGIPMIFGGVYDTSKSQDFWEDNIGITPLILKESNFTEYNFNLIFKSAALQGEDIDLDFDGYNSSMDCNDNNVSIYPNANEICDGIDNDCDTLIDEGNVCPSKKIFYIQNSTGISITSFDNLGNLILRGTLIQNSNYVATSNDEFIFQDRIGNEVMIVDLTNGNMYIDGILFENQSTLTPLDSSNDLIIKDENNNIVAYINESGYMFLKGSLTQNGI